MTKKLHMVQIGCGYWGPNLVRNFLRNKEIERYVVCDNDQRMLSKISSEFSNVETSLDSRRFLNDPTIDAVVVALPAGMHSEFARHALLANKHVFIEKPMAMNTEDARELIRIGREKNKLIMVGHTFIYNSAVRRVKKYIDDGELGRIYYIFSQRLNLGKIRQDVNAMWNLAPHDVSIILYWLDAQPNDISATGRSFLQDGIEDLVFINLGFKSHQSAHIHVSWLDPCKTRKMVIVGSKKMLIYDDVSAENKITIFDKGIDKSLKNDLKHEIYDYARFNLENRVGDIIIPKLDFDEPLKEECKHFIECILTQRQPLTNGEDGLQVVKILEKAQECLEQKRKKEYTIPPMKNYPAYQIGA